MRLSNYQQSVAEDAVKLIPGCIRSAKARYHWLSAFARVCDFESAATLACCRAARTYDKNKSGIPPYFNRVIFHSILREVEYAIRRRLTEEHRVALDSLEEQVVPDWGSSDAVIRALKALPKESREWIESHVFDEKGVATVGKQFGHSRVMSERIMKVHLRRLRSELENTP